MRQATPLRGFLYIVVATVATLAMPTVSGSSAAGVATRQEFVASWISALKSSESDVEIEVVDEMEIVAKAGGLTIQASAEQAYANYLADSTTRDEQIAILVSMVREAFETAGAAPDLARIVPVIQRAEWLTKYQLDCPYYPLPGDLIAVLAEDRADEVRYLRTGDLKQLDKSVPELFTTAIGNLRKIAPTEEHDLGSFVVLSSGGNYEAGLMLDAALIASYGKRFEGEIIFAVPSADVFVLTGRDEQDGLGGIVRAVCAHEAPSSLSPKVFAARDGVLAAVGEVECSGELPLMTLE